MSFVDIFPNFGSPSTSAVLSQVSFNLQKFISLLAFMITLLKSTSQVFDLSHISPVSAYLGGTPQKWYCVLFNGTGGTCQFVPPLTELTFITVADRLSGVPVIPTSQCSCSVALPFSVGSVCDLFLTKRI